MFPFAFRKAHMLAPSKPVALAALILSAAPLAAQELKIGIASEPTSVDPHFHNLGPNNALRRHIFEGLVSTDDAQKLTPGLATSWRAVDERPGSSSSGRA